MAIPMRERLCPDRLDEPGTSDLVVALEDDVARRGGKAAELWRAGLVPRIFPAGPAGPPGNARVALLAGQGGAGFGDSDRWQGP